jgi:hypothetical protein
MWIPRKLRQMLAHRTRSTQLLAEIAAGSDNEQRLLNDKLTEVIVALNDVSNVLHSRLDAMVAGNNNQQKQLEAIIASLNSQTRLLSEKLDIAVRNPARRSWLVGQEPNWPDRRTEGAAGD